MFTFENLTGQLFNRVLAVHPDKLPVIVDAVSGKTGVACDPAWLAQAEARIARLPHAARMTMLGPSKAQRAAPAPYYRLNGIATIAVHGSLINRGAFIGAYSGLTSYEGLRHQLRHALNDAETIAVVLDIDSAGGQAAGAFETASVVRELAAEKPVAAVIDDMAASAAYAIASGASRIFITPSGMAGSIGCVMLHLDHSERLAKAGIRPTLVHAGAHKVDGNPFQALPDGVRDDLRAEVDKAHDMFVACVAAGRKNLTPKAIRETEARCYIGADAVAAGLADEVATMESVLAEFATAQIVKNVQRPPQAVVFTQADVDRARAEGRDAGLAESVADQGLTAAFARIEAITSLPEAAGRLKTAQHLAASKDLSIETVKLILKTQPTEADVLRASHSRFGIVAQRVGE